MNSIVCTLFEGDYQFGVAALVNSLHRNGFQGDIFAGYRGNLPKWYAPAEEISLIPWLGGMTLNLPRDVRLHMLPVITDHHLTNYKPDFMLKLWSALESQPDSLFYFDPDIVISAPWAVFEDWVGCGIALCEDVNSPIPENHPRRCAWRHYFGSAGIKLKFKDALYANGGFIGVNADNYQFLETWKRIQNIMADAIGGLNRSAFKNGDTLSDKMKNDFSPFSRTDQDALNASIESWDKTPAFIGKEAMAFKAGVPVLPHALGQPKPWNTNFILRMLKGYPPRTVDKEYWKYSGYPLQNHGESLKMRKQTAIKIASAAARFYSRT